MEKINIEIKARCNNHQHIRETLKDLDSRFEGKDHQIDTYFNVPDGRLKIREGNIENALIFYRRTDQAGPKHSGVNLFKLEPGSDLKQVLESALGIKVIVDKEREIYYLDNVKVHLDVVKDLGEFVEIEAAGNPGDDQNKLEQQVNELMDRFSLRETDLIANSYSDLLQEKDQR